MTEFEVNKLLNQNMDHIRPKVHFDRKAEIAIQRELIDELYDIVELVTYEKWADVINEWRLLHRQGYVLSEKQMDYAEGIKTALIEKGVI